MWLVPLALLDAQPAHACGGFFCNPGAPVLQAAERIVFGIDPEAGEVEMHVQVTYTGPAEDFAWIVPVPEAPEIGLSTSALFTQLAIATQPTFGLVRVDEGNCRYGDGFSIGCYSENAVSGSLPTPPRVTVAAEAIVGPYETATLQADTTDDLLSWLDANGYDVPATLAPALAPYVAAGSSFVALKLVKGNDAGDLAPLMLTFHAEEATVPVQLTALSATPDMRMEVYVLSDGRGVPTSYLHVKINEAAIDWWTFGSNYADVITQAADEAGGHAFATDSHGTTAGFESLVFDAGQFDEQSLRAASTSSDWLALLPLLFVVPSTELFEVIEDQVATVGDTNGAAAWSCPSCVDLDPTFDVGAATDDLMVRVADPMRHAQDLINAYGKLTRLTSSLDAVEMTVDPVFEVNHKLADTAVLALHTATIVYECSGGKNGQKAPRRLELADGRQIALPSEDWLTGHDTTDFEVLGESLGLTKATVIEQMDAEGDPVVLFDDTVHQRELTDAHNSWVRSLLGCGCNGEPGTGVGLLTGTLALLVARRRRTG